MKDFVKILQHHGIVDRCHNVTALSKPTIAEHSWGVAMLCWHLTDGMCSTQLLMAALAHDLHEGAHGDLPHPTKVRLREETSAYDDLLHRWDNEHGVDFRLSKIERATLNLADMLEFLSWWYRQHALGNRAPDFMYTYSVASIAIKQQIGHITDLAREEAPTRLHVATRADKFVRELAAYYAK